VVLIMASTVVDPKTFESWNEAFQHPVQSTRKFEQALRNHADQNRQKLRNIVGSSYRDLLGTADRIISMDEQIQSVEGSLGVVGQLCNSRSLEKILGNAERFHKVTGIRNSTKTALASQLALLQNFITIIARLIPTDGSVLVTAKLLVLSRLLQKSLSQLQPDSELIESLRKRLAALRRRVLTAIDKRLGNPEATWKLLIDDMSAFCLTTNATPSDILRHLHAVRLKAINEFLHSTEDSADGPVKAVECLIDTLRVSQVIFPKRLSDTLSRLKDAPLLQSKDVVAIEELELRLHDPWIPEDLRNYTPWPRHDELKEGESKKQIRTWAKQAVNTLQTGLAEALEKETDFPQILKQRESIFHILPWTDTDMPGLILTEVVDDFRSIFTNRLEALIKSNAEQLSTITSALSTSLASLDGKISSTSLWDDDLTLMDAHNGAFAFKTALLRAFQGADPASIAFTEQYDQWSKSMAQVESTIKSMRASRWEADLDDPENVEERTQLLSQDDPNMLSTTFKAQQSEALKVLTSTLTALATEAPSSTHPVRQATLLLRLTRSLPLSLPASALTPLHEQLASHVSFATLGVLEKSLARLAAAESLASSTLWEGTPALPVSVLPGTYRFLREVCAAMEGVGSDIWGSSGCLDRLRHALSEGVAQLAEEAVSDILERKEREKKVKENGEKKPKEDKEELKEGSEKESEDQEGAKEEEDEEVNHEQEEIEARKQLVAAKLTQVVYDTKYLFTALRSTSSATPNLVKIADLPASSLARIDKSAAEYWKRTYLLFAIIGGPAEL
jgi:hypothetical protein